MVDAPRESKYSPENLIRMFRKAAFLRNEMIDFGFTDNGGAIHSAERILDLLGLRLNYSGLNHINNLRNYPGAEFSPAALAQLKPVSSRVTCTYCSWQRNCRLSLRSSAPGSRPASQRIWKPLQEPKTGRPAWA